jgi:hypothetical protein
MSFIRVLADGAAQAAQLVPLLFALSGVTPAEAQLPRAVPAFAANAASMAVIEPIPPTAPLTLTSNHVEVRVVESRAEVLTRLTYRNDGTVPIEARYSVPLPALVLQPGDDLARLMALADASFDCGGDESPEAARFAEAGEVDPRTVESGTLWIEPGEEVTVQMRRPAELLGRNGRRRIVLPLVVDRNATFTPQVSAEVHVESERPVSALASATHGGRVVGLGERHAVLTVANGRVYEGQFLAIEFELGAASAAPVAVVDSLAWGGEAHRRAGR